MTVLTILLGVGLTAVFVWRLQEYRKSTAYQQNNSRLARFLKWEESALSQVQEKIQEMLRIKPGIEFHPQTWIELLVLGAWAVVITRVYLNFDPLTIPTGREFNSAIQTHNLWNNFLDCGFCAFWNGSIRGGYPAFADVHGSMLHPLVVLTTLILGTVNGAKISLVLSFWAAGIAQWWIGKELRLKLIPRMFCALAAVSGGHMAGKMELGAFGVVLSTAAASLVFGALLSIYNRRWKKGAVVLAMTLASALLAGQGYMQAGLLASFPAAAFLLVNKDFQLTKAWRSVLLGCLLAGLIAAVFLVPFLHFSSNFTKYNDVEFAAAQPLQFLPLNYVIDSHDFYLNESLEKMPFPHQYIMFIGWIPILLAGVGLTSRKQPLNIKLFFCGGILLLLLTGSGDTLRLAARLWEGAGGIRHPSQIAGLSIPLILALTGLGLEKLMDLEWPYFDLRSGGQDGRRTLSLNTRWLLLIPLILNLNRCYQFTKHWIKTYQIHPDVHQVLDLLKTDSLQWVQPPYGEHIYMEPGVRKDLKLSPGVLTWQWKERDYPDPFLEASHSGQPSGTEYTDRSVNNILIYQRPSLEYAAVLSPDQNTPCQASGQGGSLTIICRADHEGHLVIKENYWTGWKAWVDGKKIQPSGAPWITIPADPGTHVYQLEYRPWDVPLGMAISVLGLIGCVVIWRVESPWLDQYLGLGEDPNHE